MMKFLAWVSFFNQKRSSWLWGLLFLFFLPFSSGAQTSFSSQQQASFFTPADSLNKKRLCIAGWGGASVYATGSFTLYHAWYKNYPLTSFHFFNDLGEWEGMDKVGHAYTAWLQSYLMFAVADWTGYSDRKSMYVGAISSTIFQSTLELMDGFSENWGFSLPDMGANFMGIGLFAAQQYYWQEQRFLLKFSSYPITYSSDVISGIDGVGTMGLNERAEALFGASYAHRLLKDYNAQSYWLSFNPETLTGEFGWPEWLNLAVGYSPANMYAGKDNTWVQDGVEYDLDAVYPRYHQFFIAPDINWAKINTRSPFLRSLFRLINAFKVPAPTLEFNDRDGLHLVFYWIYM